jgi:NTP pyrophosphatase (non-canonical NTP hydrolase)
MPQNNYIDEAHLTASDKYYGERVSLEYFRSVVKTAIESLKELDRIKKCIFYGKLIERKNYKTADSLFYKGTCAHLPYWLSNSSENDKNAVNIIHGIIGKATEAGELLEALYKTAIEGQKFDIVNMQEEIGDGLWYDALMLRAVGSNFEKVQAANIAKLKQRFPDKFNEENAENRNLQQERKSLEDGLT